MDVNSDIINSKISLVVSENNLLRHLDKIGSTNTWYRLNQTVKFSNYHKCPEDYIFDIYQTILTLIYMIMIVFNTFCKVFCC